jgi:hypothetical protein
VENGSEGFGKGLQEGMMRRGSQIDSAMFRQVLPNADLLDAVEDVNREARIASKIASEQSDARNIAKYMVRDYIKLLKEAELPWEMRKKAESMYDLISTDGLREKWVVDPYYDNDSVTNFWMAEHIEDDDDRDWQQNRLRDMLDDAINDMLIRMRVIGPRAKETL